MTLNTAASMILSPSQFQRSVMVVLNYSGLLARISKIVWTLYLLNRRSRATGIAGGVPRFPYVIHAFDED